LFFFVFYCSTPRFQRGRLYGVGGGGVVCNPGLASAAIDIDPPAGSGTGSTGIVGFGKGGRF
jgi:hypothetical protein